MELVRATAPLAGSMNALAKNLGISAATLSCMGRGRHPLSVDMIQRITEGCHRIASLHRMALPAPLHGLLMQHPPHELRGQLFDMASNRFLSGPTRKLCRDLYDAIDSLDRTMAIDAATNHHIN